MTCELSCQALAVGFPGKVLLRDVNLELSAGEVVVIVGPNGSGKTTLLRTLAFLSPTLSGEVLLQDKNIRSVDRRALHRSVAFVPHAEFVAFDFTVAEYVALGRTAISDSFFETPADWAAVELAMKGTGIEGHANQLVRTLSAGEMRLALLAQGLCRESRVLLCDEPDSNLDPAHQKALKAILRGQADLGKAVLASFHNLGLAARVADRLLVIVDGRVLTFNSVEEAAECGALTASFGVDFEVNPLSSGGVAVVSY